VQGRGSERERRPTPLFDHGHLHAQAPRRIGSRRSDSVRRRGVVSDPSELHGALTQHTHP
jgi:hypothetical protein